MVPLESHRTLYNLALEVRQLHFLSKFRIGNRLEQECGTGTIARAKNEPNWPKEYQRMC